MARLARRVLLPFLALAAGASLLAQKPALNPKTLTQDELFSFAHVWDAEVTFTRAQWDGMTPVPVVRPGTGGSIPDDPLVGRPGLRMDCGPCATVRNSITSMASSTSRG